MCVCFFNSVRFHLDRNLGAGRGGFGPGLVFSCPLTFDGAQEKAWVSDLTLSLSTRRPDRRVLRAFGLEEVA